MSLDSGGGTAKMMGELMQPAKGQYTFDILLLAEAHVIKDALLICLSYSEP